MMLLIIRKWMYRDEEDFKNLCKKAHNLCESHA